MAHTGWHLAQVNIAVLKAPMDSDLLADFVAALDPINALADASPGFVWRLKGEGNDATDLRPYDDDRIIVNMSVWESVEALSGYVYRSRHVEVLRNRRKWFEAMKDPYVALWWVPRGHMPGVLEAKERLEHLERHGPTSYAFTLRAPFPSAEAPLAG